MLLAVPCAECSIKNNVFLLLNIVCQLHTRGTHTAFSGSDGRDHWERHKSGTECPQCEPDPREDVRSAPPLCDWPAGCSHPKVNQHVLTFGALTLRPCRYQASGYRVVSSRVRGPWGVGGGGHCHTLLFRVLERSLRLREGGIC